MWQVHLVDFEYVPLGIKGNLCFALRGWTKNWGIFKILNLLQILGMKLENFKMRGEKLNKLNFLSFLPLN